MATMGFQPVCAIYSTFLQRAYDCIVHDAALQDLPVIFCMDRAGLSPQDGPTHHGLFDISYVRSVPNCIAMAPKDEDELVDMMFTATHEPHPTFIRYPRGPGERSEEHTSELQSRQYLVCRLLLEKKKRKTTTSVRHEIPLITLLMRVVIIGRKIRKFVQ